MQVHFLPSSSTFSPFFYQSVFQTVSIVTFLSNNILVLLRIKQKIHITPAISKLSNIERMRNSKNSGYNISLQRNIHGTTRPNFNGGQKQVDRHHAARDDGRVRGLNRSHYNCDRQGVVNRERYRESRMPIQHRTKALSCRDFTEQPQGHEASDQSLNPTCLTVFKWPLELPKGEARNKGSF